MLKWNFILCNQRWLYDNGAWIKTLYSCDLQDQNIFKNIFPDIKITDCFNVVYITKLHFYLFIVKKWIEIFVERNSRKISCQIYTSFFIFLASLQKDLSFPILLVHFFPVFRVRDFYIILKIFSITFKSKNPVLQHCCNKRII